MKKLALSLAVLASVAFAEGGFVGVEAGYDFRSKLSDDVSFKDSRPNLGLKGGYDFDSFRLYGSYEYGFEAKDKGIKWKNHKFLVNADFTPEITTDLKLIAGGFLGLSYIDLKAKNDGESVSDNASAAVFGLRLGAEYSLDSNNAVEFGVKADHTKYSVEDSNDKVKQTNYGLYLGYNYKF